MPPKKYFNCKSCKTKHIKPIDQLCPFMAPVQETILNEQTSDADSNPDIDMGTQILKEMKNFGSRLTNIESKVADNQNSIQNLNSASAQQQNATQVIPTMAHLQQSPVIQRGVEERMHHLNQPTESQGKYKSQRGDLRLYGSNVRFLGPRIIYLVAPLHKESLMTV